LYMAEIQPFAGQASSRTPGWICRSLDSQGSRLSRSASALHCINPRESHLLGASTHASPAITAWQPIQQENRNVSTRWRVASLGQSTTFL